MVIVSALTSIRIVWLVLSSGELSPTALLGRMSMSPSAW